MVMLQATLSTQLQNMAPTGVEATAITNLVNAYGTFASSATGNGIPLTPAGVTLGKNAMSAALIGMSADSAGLTSIPLACVAFWGAVCTGFAVSFPSSIAATPPPHAALSAAFAALMPANTSGDVTLAQAADSIATIMHTDAITGGTVTLPGTPPVVGPIL